MTDNEKILSMLENVIANQNAMQTDISGLKQGQAEIKQDLTYLKEDVETVKEDVEIVRQVATKTEYELGQQGMILREAFCDYNKLAKSHEPRISKLEDTVENLAIDVDYIKSVI